MVRQPWGWAGQLSLAQSFHPEQPQPPVLPVVVVPVPVVLLVALVLQLPGGPRQPER